MSELLTFCTCVDPRRINPATGHYPGCPDSIIPPDQLLPPHELVTRVENTLEGRGPRSERYHDGKPIFGKVVHHDLVPGRAWTEARVAASVVPAEQPAAADPSAPSADPIACVLDTETTGINDPRVCEIALAVVDLSASDPRVIARHAKLLDPGKSIEPGALRIHGITDADVRGCPTLAEVWPNLVAWVEKHAGARGQPIQVIAHNAAYDRRAITGSLPLLPGELPPWHWRCSVALAKKVVPELPSYSLHDSPGKVGLATSLSLTRGESHRAMGDVITTVSLLGALRARAGAWTSWRGDAVVWGAAKAVEAVKSAEKPVESAPEKPAPVPASPPAPSPSPKTVKGRRTVPTGPSLFDRLQEREPASLNSHDTHEKKTAS